MTAVRRVLGEVGGEEKDLLNRRVLRLYRGDASVCALVASGWTADRAGSRPSPVRE